jgi:hypothetical protein
LEFAADQQGYDAQLGRFVATGRVSARIAGGRKELVELRALGQGQSQSMFAAAGADEEDVHGEALRD